MVEQVGVLQDGPLAFEEGTLASATVEQADSPAFATSAGEVEVFPGSDASLGAVGILAAEVFDRDREVHPDS